jgi:cellulose synthase/poly-beta-1,6-N-acetylglucosamine synthase-like glycosyltransferase
MTAPHDTGRDARPNHRQITTVIPAHNEGNNIAATMTSLRTQTVPPDRIVVVCDNCIDDTERLARETGADVFVTRDNTDKKAGAINQAMGFLLPVLDDAGFVLVMDADSVLAPNWIETALHAFDGDATVGAVGGIFYGEGARGLIYQLQRNEYIRYARDILRRRKGVWVLTGTSSMFRVPVLREVRSARGGVLPGSNGDVYNVDAITEDMEITLALLTLGYRCVSPKECSTTTELMPSWRDLWNQRIRWQRGAADNLRAYGLTRTTLPYLLQQVWAVMGFAIIVGYPALFGVSLAIGLPLVFHPFWLAVGALFVIDRVVTVRKGGWPAIGLTLTFLPEMGYDFFRFGVYVAGWFNAISKREAKWHHALTERV